MGWGAGVKSGWWAPLTSQGQLSLSDGRLAHRVLCSRCSSWGLGLLPHGLCPHHFHAHSTQSSCSGLGSSLAHPGGLPVSLLSWFGHTQERGQWAEGPKGHGEGGEAPCACGVLRPWAPLHPPRCGRISHPDADAAGPAWVSAPGSRASVSRISLPSLIASTPAGAALI